VTATRAVIFDLGGTLIDWHDWDAEVPQRWARCHGRLLSVTCERWAPLDTFVEAMAAAEAAHWKRVTDDLWSGPPSGVVSDGLRTLGIPITESAITTVLDAYATAVDGRAFVFPDAVGTLTALRARGLRIGLLSNTWWAAEWHNAEIALHGLAPLIDERVYTSDMPHSKPHPSVFREIARRLGVAPEECTMVGDRPNDDIAGALGAGMRAIWKTNGRPMPNPHGVVPTATIRDLQELRHGLGVSALPSRP
jgi:putative hydrolase of the HAD superfamily